MGILPSIDTLGRISAFVLNRMTDDFRLELHQHLIMMALYEDKKGKGMTKDSIVSSIEKDLNVKGFPRTLVNTSLKGLHEKNSVKSVHGKGGNIYLLAQDEKARIRLMKEQYSQTVAQVKMGLGQKMGERGNRLDMTQEAIVFATFRNFLASVLSGLGTECCFAIIGSHGKKMSSLKPVNAKDVLSRILETVEDEKLRRLERQVFLEYISNPDDALSDFLFSLAQSYFFIQILHLDPKCQSLTRESLQRKRIYLDTNVIYNSLTGTKRRKAVDHALKLTATLGITTVISKRTKEEFITLIRNRRKSFGENPKVPKKRFDKVQNRLDDGFLKDFLKKKYKNPNLTFDRYADRLEEIEAVMKNRYATVFDDSEHKEIYENPNLPELKDVVTKEGERFGLLKSDIVAEHDAFHILLVQELRKEVEGDVLGPSCWFLTHDRSLLFVEEEFEKYERFPSSIFIDNWVQLISPLLSPKQTVDARDAYMSLFASRLPMLTGVVDEEVFLRFQGKWMDDEDLTEKDTARIIGNRYVKDYYDWARDKEKPISEEDKEKLIKPIIVEVKRQGKATAWMKKDIIKLQKTTEELQGQIIELKSISKRQRSILFKLGHIVGVGLFIILSILFYEFFVLVHSVGHSEALFWSMIFAAAAGAIGDFCGYRWLLKTLLRSKSLKQAQIKEISENEQNSEGSNGNQKPSERSENRGFSARR